MVTGQNMYYWADWGSGNRCTVGQVTAGQVGVTGCGMTGELVHGMDESK